MSVANTKFDHCGDIISPALKHLSLSWTPPTGIELTKQELNYTGSSTIEKCEMQ
jgi:hypothetical protein